MKTLKLDWKKNIWIRQVFRWILLILSIFIARTSPEFVEKIYFQNIYPLIAISNRWFVQWFSFSIGDVLYVLVIGILFYLLTEIFLHFRNPKRYIIQILQFLWWIVLLFYLSWGLNYFRPPLYKILNFSAINYNTEQLAETTLQVLEKTNDLQYNLTGNDTIPVSVPYGLQNVLQKTPLGYREISHFIKQKYYMPTIKKSLLSPLISYMQVSGYLNPFTGESQINYLYPKFAIPFIASHEVAHQLGYAPEDEANFLGFLSSIHHPDPYFQYSGYIAALHYLLMELKKTDEDLFYQYIKQLHKGVIKNFLEEQKFSKKYQIKFDTSKAYDSYLKLNKQKKGIQSYNEMVKYLVGYYKDQK